MEKKSNISGIEINYFDNQKNSQPVICLHGWGQSYHSFDHLISALNNDYRVVAIDLPGFGKSQEPTTPFSIYDYEEILDNFITKLKLENVIIVGHSFGGRIGIIYANNHKQNLSKLVLTGAAGIKPKKTLLQKIKSYHYKFMKLLTKTFIFSQWRDDLLKNSGSEDYKNASDMMKKVLVNVVNEDLKPLIPNISAPTLLYWGIEDDATPIIDAYYMEEFIPNSTLYSVSGHGHFAFLTNYQDFNEKVISFLKK